MKSIKLLLVSFTITFVALMTISPALAKPSVKIQYLNVNHSFSKSFASYDIIKAAAEVPHTLSTQNSNSFSSGLILSSSRLLIEDSSQLAINVVSQSNEFFSSALMFNDKFNQFISFFSAPTKGDTSGQLAPLAERNMKEKCKNSVDYS
ncbi:hypothetical protein [Colwellia piezophila]|uniref:hypothetical protein n=1 Tax=Colwellia piezophila TaxID=211668 RepID=UPI000368EEC2|nr:hypothetical protein [Colwellia piezophila]